jgi:hypothetical protein
MSKLYIRVKTGFYTHRKTAKLRTLIGDDAFWIPPRLWAYAAESQPDGDLSGYSSEELAMLLGCSKHAPSMLQALKDCGFVDSQGLIHDWTEHNGYHTTFADRARKASAVRWGKESPPTPPKGKRKEDIGDCLEHATSTTQACLEHKPVDEEPESFETAFESGSPVPPEVQPDQPVKKPLPKPSDTIVLSIYDAYPRKVAKPEALKAIAKAIKKIDPIVLLARTKSYAMLRGQNNEFTPHPATWFNQERFNDDPETWVVKTDKSPLTNQI